MDTLHVICRVPFYFTEITVIIPTIKCEYIGIYVSSTLRGLTAAVEFGGESYKFGCKCTNTSLLVGRWRFILAIDK